MSLSAEQIGQRLRAERERRALSVDKAADDLHFDLSIIEALEAGDFARLGPAVYGKGHLKRYAEYLGLAPAELLEAFANRPAETAAAATPGQGAASSALRLPADPAAGGDPQWLPAAGAAAVVVVAMMLWWKPWHPRGVSAPPSGAATSTSAVAPPPASAVPEDGAAAPAGSPAVPDVDATMGSPPASLAAEARPKADAEPAAAGVGRAKLRLRFSADSWVDVHDATGVRVFAGKGRANSVRTISGAAPMRVYIGFASGVQLEVNNHAVAIGPQFVAGDVARFEAGADGVLRRDSHPRDMAARNPQPRT
jgi:cytoskeleton protein RodZ